VVELREIGQVASVEGVEWKERSSGHEARREFCSHCGSKNISAEFNAREGSQLKVHGDVVPLGIVLAKGGESLVQYRVREVFVRERKDGLCIWTLD